MGRIASQISRARRDVFRATEQLMAATALIQHLQQNCEHSWKFNRQYNDHHRDNWIVVDKCPECDLEQNREPGPPVCETCDIPLVRVGKEDAEAEEERQKEKYKGHYNPPLAFRCTNQECRRIHILYHLGD